MIAETDRINAFISYSWSTPEHEEWVLTLANRIVEAGINVLLDKWDLKEGHDSTAFMERMVTDDAISRVIIISDAKYVEKANLRSGGVGTETQIISRKVYESANQEKFVVVVAEKDSDGRPYVPVYYGNRIYIDLSEVDLFDANFEKLLRWLYGKPLHVKPPLGKRPTFLDDEAAIQLGTTALSLSAMNALRGNKPNAGAVLSDYLDTFSEHLDRFRVTKQEGVEFDDLVVRSIDEFAPYKNEFLSVVSCVARYMPNDDNAQRIHRFIEAIYPYIYRPATVQTWQEWDFDNFRFIVHELFLHALAAFLMNGQFAAAATLLDNVYYSDSFPNDQESGTQKFTGIRQYMRSLEYRNQRLNLHRLSLRADMLKRRAEGVIKFSHLMQADFVAFLRASVDASSAYDQWWPDTLLYASEHRGPFEIFARARSRAYFAKIRTLLNVETPEQLQRTGEKFRKGELSVPKWEFSAISVSTLANLQNIGVDA